ncbi:MAG: hypothetical protein A2041_12680 [Bacteroidetes bacterium GWA2_31_9b]|nr:MAG: hypothetical protein A2041_12680 [Bacteroidetes bacterium GWA2_31_9b]
MKTFKTVTIVLAFGILFSCRKEDDLNKQPSDPKLKAPINGSVTDYDEVTFEWDESTDPENDEIDYTLFISNDSLNWKSYSYVNSKTKISNNEQTYLYYSFEPGKKYYWKVKAENKFQVNPPQQETGEAISKTFHFFTMPNSVINLRDTSGHEFVNLYWEDPQNLDYVEIRVEPEINNLTQPVIIDAGVQKLELTGLENGTIYTFFVKACNILGHISKANTLRVMPLDPTQVHDADFNIYNITQIGEQTWLRENLRTTKWQDGTPMENQYGDKYYVIGSQSDIYGYYYYPSSFNNSAGKNPCPYGYHVPTDEEWKELEKFLEMPEDEIDDYCDYSNTYRGEDFNVGNMLKSVTGWLDYNGENGNGIDFYQFNLLPAGYIFNGEEIGFGELSILYSSTNEGEYFYKYRGFYNNTSGIKYCQTNLSISIRCIKD